MHELIPALLTIPRHYAKKISPQHKIHIHSMLSNFNVIENVLSRMHTGLLTAEMIAALGSYLEWILTESEVSPPFFSYRFFFELLHPYLLSE